MAANFPSSALGKLGALWLILVWRPLAWLFPRMFGRIDWQAPTWGRWVGNAGRRGDATVRRNPRAAASGVLLVALLAAAGWYGYRWWQSLRKPVEVSFKVTAPARTEIEAEAVEARKPKPALITFDQSVAPLSQVGKDIVAAITLSPALAGTWHWDDDKTLGGLVGKGCAADSVAWTPPTPGRFELRVVDQRGRADSRDIDVEFAP